MYKHSDSDLRIVKHYQVETESFNINKLSFISFEQFYSLNVIKIKCNMLNQNCMEKNQIIKYLRELLKPRL